MAKVDNIYGRIIRNIDKFGAWDKDVRPRWEDGKPAYTKSILNVQMKFDNGKEIPLLTSKRVPMLDPIREMFWIWQKKSNDVRLLRNEFGCHVWDEWERPDGTIGKAYGWQLKNKKRKVKKSQLILDMMIAGFLSPNVDLTTDEEFAYFDQVDYLLYTLMTNKYSRRIKTTLWCVEDLDDMALEPCVYETHWQTWNNTLNLTVCIRSNDMGLGNPYNIYQYAMLHRMIAQVTNMNVGELCFNIDNAHIYDRHLGALMEQIDRETFEAPEIILNPTITSFYDFKGEDITVKNYKHSGKVNLEVAI